MKQDRPSATGASALDALPLQFAALPVREGEHGLEVLLVTSRETGRWIIPKGWPMKNRKPHQAAAQEAFEEAGVKGRVHKKAIGQYQAFKRFEEHFVLCTVHVYEMEVTDELQTWKEMHQRRRAWFPAARAALLVDEPGLASLIESLPRRH